METINRARPEQQFTRRNLLKRAALAGAVGLGLLSLAACGGEQAQADEPAQRPASTGEQTAGAGSADIAAVDLGARKSLKYVDQDHRALHWLSWPLCLPLSQPGTRRHDDDGEPGGDLSVIMPNNRWIG